MSFPEMEYMIRIILKYMINIAKVLGLKGCGTLKAISIYQFFSASFCNILPKTILEFETLQMIQSLLQRIIRIGNNCSNGGDI